jgi:hypothetical protein
LVTIPDEYFIVVQIPVHVLDNHKIVQKQIAIPQPVTNPSQQQQQQQIKPPHHQFVPQIIQSHTRTNGFQLPIFIPSQPPPRNLNQLTNTGLSQNRFPSIPPQNLVTNQIPQHQPLNRFQSLRGPVLKKKKK